MKKKLFDVEIGLVAPFPPPYGGMGTQFERLAMIFMECGCSIQKIRIEWVDDRTPLRSVKRFWSFVHCAGQVILSKSKIIHATTGSINNCFLVGLITLAGRVTGKKVILSIGGGEFLLFSQHATFFMKFLMKIVLSIPHILAPCNEDMRQSVANLQIPSEKNILISNALPNELGDRTEMKPDVDYLEFCQHHHPIILYVGALQSHYGLLDLVRATEDLKKDFPSIGVAAFVKEGGDKDFTIEVNSKVKVGALKDSFIIFVSVPWVVAAMKQADVMVRATNVFEEILRAVREALAVGLSVVASNLGLRPKEANLYKAGDVTELTAALRKVFIAPTNKIPITDPEGEQNIQRYLALYNKLLHK